MRTLTIGTVCLATVFVAAAPASAQTWNGAYAGVTAGSAMSLGRNAETVRFDTNLDGSFSDTVRTAAGADAFSPGFCGGIASGVFPSFGCKDDEGGVDIGGRVGYDWRTGPIVIGGLVDITGADVSDGVSAFSTTPAFYAFSRELKHTLGFRGRAGAGNARVLVYATGGGAWASIDHMFTSSNAVNTFVPAKDDVRTDGAWGYQAGGGAEVRIGGRWSVTGEYLFSSYDDLEDGTVRSMGPAAATNPFILVNPAGTDLQRSDRFEFHAVRAGLSYRF